MDTQATHARQAADGVVESPPQSERPAGSESDETAQGATKTARSYQVLDCARLVAILSIVWLHTPESREMARAAEVGRFAVPFFTMAAMFLAFDVAGRRPEMAVGGYFCSRTRRIYVTFLIWSLLYAAVRVLSARVMHGPPPRITLLDVVWDGTAHHLWFMPFVCAASTLGFASGRVARHMGSRYWPFAGACAGAGLVFACLHHVNSSGAWGNTISLSIDALPSVGLAIGLSMAHARLPRAFFNSTPVTLVGLALWLSCVALLVGLGRTTLLETLAGLGLMAASLRHGEVSGLRWMAGWGGLSLQIYLLHVLFLDGFQDVARKFGYEARPWVDGCTFLFTVLACAASVAIINRLPRLRKLMF